MKDIFPEDMSFDDRKKHKRFYYLDTTTIRRIKKIYRLNKTKEKGEEVVCPVCEMKFIKKSSVNVFCSNGARGINNCKEFYWNNVVEQVITGW